MTTHNERRDQAVVRVWRSPDGETLRVRWDDDGPTTEVTNTYLGYADREVDDVPADWTELTAAGWRKQGAAHPDEFERRLTEQANSTDVEGSWLIVRQAVELFRAMNRPTLNEDELRRELANKLHEDWCGCDSWDGANCEDYSESEFAEQAAAALSVIANAGLLAGQGAADDDTPRGGGSTSDDTVRATMSSDKPDARETVRRAIHSLINGPAAYTLTEYNGHHVFRMLGRDMATIAKNLEPVLPALDRARAEYEQLRQQLDSAVRRHLRTARAVRSLQIERDERQARIDATRSIAEEMRSQLVDGPELNDVLRILAALTQVSQPQPETEPQRTSDLSRMKAAAVKCCRAGREAYPDPCPWHPLPQRSVRAEVSQPQPPRPDGRPQGDPTPCDCGQAPQHHHHIEGGPAVEVSRPQEGPQQP